MLLSPVPETDALSRDDVVAISKTWWVFLIMGTLSVIAGVILMEIDSTLNVACFVGAIFVVRGLFDLATRPVDGAPQSWSIGTGVINIAMGVILLAWPEPTLRVIAAIIGIWLLIAGLLLFSGGIANHGEDSLWWVTMSSGAISIVLGISALRRPRPHPLHHHRPRRHLGDPHGGPRDHRCLRGEAATQALRQAGQGSPLTLE